MSCFIVSYPCLKDVFTIVKLYKPELIGVMTHNEFINSLSKLNHDSFSGRYMEANTYQFLEYNTDDSTRHELTMFFNLISFNYQCDEEQAHYTDLYKQLNKFEKDLMVSFSNKYIGKSEGYEKDYNALRQYMKNNNIDYFWGK